jgi:hypothetical protein
MSIKRNSAPGMYTMTRLLRFVELARNWFVQGKSSLGWPTRWRKE